MLSKMFSYGAHPVGAGVEFMAYVKSFLQLDRHDTALAGGKGASLGELTRAGIPVPTGFVVLSTAFDTFLRKTGVIKAVDSLLATVDPNALDMVEHASEKIENLVRQAEFPREVADEVQTYFRDLKAPWVAVRSSATAEDGSSAAWAGQLETFLNTNERTLIGNIQRCWASLFTSRAVSYRFAKGMQGQHISVAVVVQAMVQSEVSGVAFSVHPLTQDSNQLIIEAGFGLGEAIVSGQITPDGYVVDKHDRLILDTNTCRQERMLVRSVAGGVQWVDVPSEKQALKKLSGQQILALADIVIDIEKHYGFPCDIEWTMVDSMFSITQSRPITTLSR